MWLWLIILIIFFVIFIRIRTRKYFWKTRSGEKITLKQFWKKFWQGVDGITPLQQVKTTLMSFIPVFAGLIWGIVVTLMMGTYWLSLILVGSLPITAIQFISNLQKYKRLKTINEQMRELNKKTKK